MRERRRSGRCKPSPGRVKEWRLRRRCGLSVAPRFLWECLTSRTISWFPSPATSNRTCGFPADGFPTTFDRRRSRAPPTSPRQIEGLNPTLSKPGVGITGDEPLHTRHPPVQQAKPHVTVQGLQLLGGVAHPEGVAPPTDERVECGDDRRQGPAQAPPQRLAPNLAAHRCEGFLARPHEGHQAPALPRLDFLEVES
jgi:hypothetical protein